MEMRRLWYSRHHYMSRIIGEERVNVAVVDGDMSIQTDFYPLLKAPPLAQHNLIYTLDHTPDCGDLNVGFAYCQNCAPNGRAQWALDEGLRREGYYCGGQASQSDSLVRSLHPTHTLTQISRTVHSMILVKVGRFVPLFAVVTKSTARIHPRPQGSMKGVNPARFVAPARARSPPSLATAGAFGIRQTARARLPAPTAGL
eukprot:6178434-Pleurochrysis_carterae.AAC.1